MNIATVDLNDEDVLAPHQRQALLGMVRCELVSWPNGARKRYQKKVTVLREYGGRSRWYAECRAYQVMLKGRQHTTSVAVYSDGHDTATHPEAIEALLGDWSTMELAPSTAASRQPEMLFGQQ